MVGYFSAGGCKVCPFAGIKGPISLALPAQFSHNLLLPTCGVPQAQKPHVSNHCGFCFVGIFDANKRIY
jgi:hypothetical protein